MKKEIQTSKFKAGNSKQASLQSDMPIRYVRVYFKGYDQQQPGFSKLGSFLEQCEYENREVKIQNSKAKTKTASMRNVYKIFTNLF
jgi:hypothetical protein